MALIKHLEEAADRLKHAGARVKDARVKPITPESLHEWLNALTDYSFALSIPEPYKNSSRDWRPRVNVNPALQQKHNWANPYVTRSAEEPTQGYGEKRRMVD